MRSHPRLASVALAATFSLPVLAAMGCTPTPTGPNSSTTAGSRGANSSSSPSDPTTTTPSTYANIAELAQALNDKGIPCVLSYPGIKDDVGQVELSICTIDNEQAFLRVWQGPELVTKFLASPDGQTGTLAVGANWTISFQTPAAASKVANTLGGSAPGASRS